MTLIATALNHKMPFLISDLLGSSDSDKPISLPTVGDSKSIIGAQMRRPHVIAHAKLFIYRWDGGIFMNEIRYGS
jgi:hypothetical protein